MKANKVDPTPDNVATSDEKSVKADDDITASQPASLSKLYRLARPEMCVLIVGMFVMVVVEASGLVIPILVARAYDDLVDTNLTSEERMSNINWTMTLVLAIHMGGTVLGFLRTAAMGIAGERIVARTRNQVYASILRQEVAFFDKTKSGELVSRLGSDTAMLEEGASSALPEVVIGATTVTVSIAIMFWLSAKLAGLMVALVVIVMAICVPFGMLMGRLATAYQDVLGTAQTYSTEALGSVRTVQSFAAEEREKARYSKYIGDPDRYTFWWPTDRRIQRTTYSVGYFKAMTAMAFYTCIFGLGFAGMFLCLWYGFKLVNDGEMTLGQLTAFQSYIFQIGASLGTLSHFVTKVIEAIGAASRLFFLLDRVPAIPTPDTAPGSSDAESPDPPKKPSVVDGAIDFNQVCFSYPSRPDVEVLTNFSLSISPNETAALVGASGSGKSTVVSLLQRFYDVSSGSITLDGNDIRSVDLQWLRSNISFVQQEPQLFGLSVRENIAYGMNRDVTQAEIEAAAREANAHDFVSKFPDGYDTLVGERGIQLSGGQKQRLAIARALLPQPKILLLDEATSALDAESEHLVQEAIDKAMVGRTVIVVAHRLSTIQRANQIVVVDNHQIVDIGTHSELLQRCSKYQDLIKRQHCVTRHRCSLKTKVLSCSMPAALHANQTTSDCLR